MVDIATDSDMTLTWKMPVSPIMLKYIDWKRFESTNSLSINIKKWIKYWRWADYKCCQVSMGFSRGSYINDQFGSDEIIFWSEQFLLSLFFDKIVRATVCIIVHNYKHGIKFLKSPYLYFMLMLKKLIVCFRIIITYLNFVNNKTFFIMLYDAE